MSEKKNLWYLLWGIVIALGFQIIYDEIGELFGNQKFVIAPLLLLSIMVVLAVYGYRIGIFKRSDS